MRRDFHCTAVELSNNQQSSMMEQKECNTVVLVL
jgi:hypothetical protein